jgi:hypothetical protein
MDERLNYLCASLYDLLLWVSGTKTFLWFILLFSMAFGIAFPNSVMIPSTYLPWWSGFSVLFLEKIIHSSGHLSLLQLHHTLPSLILFIVTKIQSWCSPNAERHLKSSLDQNTPTPLRDLLPMLSTHHTGSLLRFFSTQIQNKP